MTDPTRGYPEDVMARLNTYLGWKLYVIDTRPVDPELERTLIADHLDHQVDLERRGILFAAGPLRDSTGTRVAGLIIIRATSLDDAQQIADADPMHRGGARTYTIHEWTVNEGGLEVRVQFSDQSARIR